jgi:multicomponent Na+:H+ antiporter subunit G
VILDVLAGVLLVLGAVLCAVAGIGLLRLPDVFARMHAATKPATLGLLLIALGAILRVGSEDLVELLLVISVQFLTAPVGAHMVGRAAYNAGGQLGPDTAFDELATARRDPARRPPP